MNKIFSIDKNHKLFNILGIKIKFKLSNRELKEINRKKNNKIIIHKLNNEIIEKQFVKGVNIDFECTNSTIELWEPFNFKDCYFLVKGNNNHIKLKQECIINSLSIHLLGNNSNINVGRNFFLTGKSYWGIIDDGININIGNDCLMGKNTSLVTTDWHTIYNINDIKDVQNKPKFGITIGNHVWLCNNVTLLKDVKIPNNTVLSLGSIITKKFEKEYTIIGGIPGKIIKENINWDKDLPSQYLKQFKETI